MQDQGKRLLLAVALALGVMMLWQVLFPPDEPPPKPPIADGSGSAVEPTVAGSPVGQPLTPPAGAGSGSAVGSGSAAVVEVPRIAIEGYGLRLDLDPPFTIARSEPAPKGKPDTFTLTHQDAGGTRSLVIEPAAPGKAPLQIRAITKPAPGYQVGDKGTIVKLGDGMHDAQGVAVIATGPVTTGWEIVSGTNREPWAADLVCASEASAKGVTCHPKDAVVAAGSGAGSGSGSDSAGSGSGSGSATPPAIMTPPPPVAPPVAVAPCTGPEKTFAFENVSITTTACGGAVRSWRLLAKKYERERRKGEMVAPQGKGALLVNFAASTIVIPPDATWTAGATTESSIVYTWESPELLVEKTLELLAEDYLVKTKIVVTAKTGAARQSLAITTYGYQAPGESTSHARGNTEWKAACLRDGEVRVAGFKQLLDRPRMENGVKWAGFTEGYIPGSRFSAAMAGQFIVATSPRPAGPGDMVACNAYPVPGMAGLMQVDLIFPPADVRAGDPPLIREMATYLGPTSYELLEAADTKVGFATGFKEVPDFGWFGVIGRPLLWLLHKFYGMTGNWGLAIVLLTILVKLSTLYFTTRSMRSMKAMAALTPKMKELQEKHKEDRQKLQQETMALYKQHGVNPLAGCLPILLQMPIWIALYRMLSSAGELYLEPLIPGWISDLTSPDPYHILPVVLIATMFAQAKLQPQTATGMQQKILMYGLPLMFGVASFFFPSGLSLYIVTNTILSALHSIYMNKYDKKGQAMVAALAPKVGGGGGGSSSSKAEVVGGKGAGARGDSSKKPARASVKPTIEVEDRSPDDDTAEPVEAGTDDEGPDGSEADDSPSGAGAGAETATAAQRSRRPSKARRKRRGRN
jgi:YidC/Oxa1 family membrane protein insertase